MTKKEAFAKFLRVGTPLIILEPLTQRQSEIYPLLIKASEIEGNDDEQKARAWVSKYSGIPLNSLYGPAMEIKDKGYYTGYAA